MWEPPRSSAPSEYPEALRTIRDSPCRKGEPYLIGRDPDNWERGNLLGGWHIVRRGIFYRESLTILGLSRINGRVSLLWEHLGFMGESQNNGTDPFVWEGEYIVGESQITNYVLYPQEFIYTFSARTGRNTS